MKILWNFINGVLSELSRGKLKLVQAPIMRCKGFKKSRVIIHINYENVILIANFIDLIISFTFKKFNKN